MIWDRKEKRGFGFNKNRNMSDTYIHPYIELFRLNANTRWKEILGSRRSGEDNKYSGREITNTWNSQEAYKILLKF
jgi:hypothetical protein